MPRAGSKQSTMLQQPPAGSSLHDQPLPPFLLPLSAQVFTIGRSNGTVKNDFEIDGMGIQDVHCEVPPAAARRHRRPA